FFFQAEDGIRDLYVTGVQTCALPIWAHRSFVDGTRPVVRVAVGGRRPERASRRGTGSLPEQRPREDRRGRAAGLSPAGDRPDSQIGRASCREKEAAFRLSVVILNQKK